LGIVAKIKKLLTPFFAQGQTMSASLKLFSPGSDEFAFFIEHHNGIPAVTRGMNGVVDLDVTLHVLAHSMGVPILDVAGELPPVMSGFVFVVPFTHDGRLVAKFVCGAQNQRSGDGHSGCEKTSSRDFHAFCSWYL
jgi:hypothetical protein